MKIPAKRFNKKLPLPKYEKGAAGFDFICSKDVKIDAGKIMPVPLNMAMAIPDGYVLLLFVRSSTPNRFGLMLANSVGIVDPFFKGSNDQIVALLYNFTETPIHIKKGDRIVQGIIVKFEEAEFDESIRLRSSRHQTWRFPKRRKV